MIYARLATRLGPLAIAESTDGLTAITFDTPDPSWRLVDALASDAVPQLQAYFTGERFDFDLPLAPQGTPFQQAVWQALCTIPYGETATYGDIAQRLGNPNAVRAVGAANGQNPLAIVVPCHRIIGHDGTLTGYAGGLERKAALLALERKHCPQVGQQLALL